MQGLDLSERYFNEFGIPMIKEKFPRYQGQIAAGLVGSGSECFSFDDEISRDHDWGPSFCLWLNQETYQAIGVALQKEYEQLPGEFAGVPCRNVSAWGEGRTGVFEIGQFYKQFIGFDHVPADLLEWRLIPETYLATATNGRVFTDPSGEFSSFRQQLKAFYPEDIRLKKIAARCMTMAQSGQYNLMRTVKRGELVAAQCCETEFINGGISMVFLLNKEYKPFYKWMHKALKRLPILGEEMYQLYFDLVRTHQVSTGQGVYEKKAMFIEEICRQIIEELKLQGLTDSDSDFLLDHGPLVQRHIMDPRIQAMNVWVE
ncbi:DUF4037 domain-containing protein [Dehalobacterium formicoaceticum]|uniref:DUF4037 domain-containing protein n=1 Tax=Dehalobacterium formicoaceticum TaxID=51515 RepID=UPI0031F62141